LHRIFFNRVTDGSPIIKQFINMKAARIKTIFLILLLITAISNIGTAQKCNKKELCDKANYADFDFRSQSSSAQLAPGDTARTAVVVYAKTQVRIMVCSESTLGDVTYRILSPTRKTKRVIDKIDKRTEQVAVYKKDKDGNPIQQINEWTSEPMIDGNGAPVYELDHYEELANYDTTYRTVEYNDEVLVYDSRNSEKAYWQENTSKTRRLIIEVVIPGGDAESTEIEGCVSVMVGSKNKQEAKTFKKN